VPRIFVCVEAPDSIRHELRKVQELLPSGETLRLTNPDQIHLTLRFLGDLTQPEVALVTEAASAAARATRPFSISMGGMGAFPNSRRPNVIWVGVDSGRDELQALHRRLETELVKQGFGREAKPFTAHLTLARVKQRAACEEIKPIQGVLAGSGWHSTRPTWPVAEVVVMESALGRKGAVHTTLSRHPFPNR
jgi:2'-5' RNA ligase